MSASSQNTSSDSPSASSLKRQDKLSTRQQIMEFSADMLRIKGIEGFSFLDVARFMGISKASVHHHFPKKVDLALALCDWTEDWLKQGLEHFEAQGSSQWDKLLRYVRAAERMMLDEKKLCPISAFHSDLNKLPEEVKQRLALLDQYELSWVSSVIQQGIDSGEFAVSGEQQHADALAGLFIFSCKGALYHARLHGQSQFKYTLAQLEALLAVRAA